MNGVEASLFAAHETIPGMVSAALVLVPDGVLVASVGASNQLELEPLVRSALRVAEGRAQLSGGFSPFVDYAFVSEDRVVVIARGLQQPHVALTVVCKRDANLALVLGSTRQALAGLEAQLDWSVGEESA